MEAIELLKTRRSIRNFKDKKVDREIMKEIIDVARFAPSWKNFQIARYTIIDDESIIQSIGENCVNGFMYNTKTLKKAKGLAVLSYVKGQSGTYDGKEYATKQHDTWEIFDAGIACQQFCLAAYAKGISTVIMGIFDDDMVAKAIDLPENEAVAALIVYGYIDGENPNPRNRLAISEITRFL